MEKYLSQVPIKIQSFILDLAASQGINNKDYNNTELIGFVQGAIAMYFFQQHNINILEVEIDLLEADSDPEKFGKK